MATNYPTFQSNPKFNSLSSSNDIIVNGTTIGKGPNSLSYNTVFGYSAGASTVSGNRNVAIGYYSLYTNTNGMDNTSIGFGSLSTTDMGYNTAIGANSLGSINGSGNIGIGAYAGSSMETGNNNVFIGAYDGLAYDGLSNYIVLSDGGGNVRLTVDNSGYTTLNNNLGIGGYPSYKLDVFGTGRFASNVEITGTLKAVTQLTASSINASSISSFTSSGDLIVNGLWLGRGRLSTTTSTVAFGFDALSSSAGGTAGNTAIGNTALKNTTGPNNTAVGTQTLSANTTGANNTALGSLSLNSNTTGSLNTAIGLNSLRNLVSGSNNTAIGPQAGTSATALANAVIIGGNNGSTINTTTGSIIISDGAGNIRIQANNTGLVTIPGTLAVSGGIQFPATQNVSSDPNTLDDYEEGTWTPELSASTTNNYTYTTQSGRYIKIGRLVTCYGYIRLNLTGSSSGLVSVSALPFSGNSYGTLYVDYMNAFSASVTTPIRGSTGLFGTFNSFSLLFSNDTSLQNTNLTNNSGFTFFISYQATS